MLREGQGFLKVQVAEEWCQSGVAIATGSSSDRTALGEKVSYKGLSPIPIGQASILISPGQARGTGQRDPHHAWVRRHLPWPEEHLSRTVTGVTWEEDLGGGLEEPLDMPVHLMIQDLETGPFLSPSPSCLSLGHAGIAVSPQPSTLALKAAASIISDRKPTVDTPLTPSPSPPPFILKDRYYAPGKAGGGPSPQGCAAS